MTDYNIIARQWIETNAKLKNLTNELYKLPFMAYIENVLGVKYDSYGPRGIEERNGVLCVRVECTKWGYTPGGDEDVQEFINIPLEDLLVEDFNEHFKKLRAEREAAKAEEARVAALAKEAEAKEARRTQYEQLRREFE